MDSESVPEVVRRFFVAMQAGSSSASEMIALFHDDAEYTEPFSGAPTTHRGKAAIRTAMEPAWQHPLPDMTITMDRVDATASSVRAEWTCRSTGLPGGFGRGVNVFDLRDGRIAKLVTTLLFG